MVMPGRQAGRGSEPRVAHGQVVRLPEGLDRAVGTALAAWRAENKTRRLWAKDAALWTGGDEASWLGWLDIAPQRQSLDGLRQFAAEVRSAGIASVLLLGMGGSSLGPEVLARIFGRQPGHPELMVLDSTDPAQILAAERHLDLARTLVIVSSKSGTTLETDLLMRHFLARVAASLGEDHAGSRFVAITDPGSALEKAAERARFRRVFLSEKSIGGRYSVLSPFGLVPAAVMGLDPARLLDGAEAMARACGPGIDPAGNPGVALGLVLGAAAAMGRDKLTIVASTGVADFGAWLAQLLAESTGKRGRGLVPVDAEALGPRRVYGEDRIFVRLRLRGEDDPAQRRRLAALASSGHPLVDIEIGDRYGLGGEFLRWEIATAVAGAVLGIDPFDQPDVEASKIRTRALTDACENTGSLPDEIPILDRDGLRLFADPANAAALAGAARGHSAVALLRAHLGRLRAGDYCAILAYIERNEGHIAALQRIRTAIRDRMRVATCSEFGPRFLHSTGQLHKGGPASGLFLEVTCDDGADLPIEGRRCGFALVKAAQARGDFEVLAERGRRVLRVHLGGEVGAGLAALEDAIRRALAGRRQASEAS